jgi:hypothetical protein
MTVTPEAAGSSPVDPANPLRSDAARKFSVNTVCGACDCVVRSHLQHNCLTRYVVSVLDGGFSPSPTVCSISWMIAARVSSGERCAARTKSRPQRYTTRLPVLENARIPSRRQSPRPAPSTKRISRQSAHARRARAQCRHAARTGYAQFS